MQTTLLCGGMTAVILASAACVGAENTTRSGAAKADVVRADDPQTLPAEVDLRPVLAEYGMKPRKQGRRNTCSVFTTTAVIEFALDRQAERGEPLSPEFLNWACNQVIDNRTSDRGQFFHDLLRGFAKYGICAEQDMPYADRFDPELSPSRETQAAARAAIDHHVQIHWIRRWTREQGLSTEQFIEIKRVLAAGWPVAAGSDHSRLFVGYQDDPGQPGGGTFVTMDSALGKFASVSYEFAITRLGDAFWAESPPPSTNEE